jgi:hypothetical protein
MVDPIGENKPDIGTRRPPKGILLTSNGTLDRCLLIATKLACKANPLSDLWVVGCVWSGLRLENIKKPASNYHGGHASNMQSKLLVFTWLTKEKASNTQTLGCRMQEAWHSFYAGVFPMQSSLRHGHGGSCITGNAHEKRVAAKS